ncbi:MAG: ATP-dependent helicase [Gammaproteobacteria bacterium]|nr:ATP-dependent helicase [Gammaproteobacteria bacterium]
MPINYTEEQVTVINHDETNSGVVRAGPGTGKSITIVALAHRLAQAGKQRGVKFLTFTRAATSELLKKVSDAEGLDVKPSTIHSFSLSILMQNQDALLISLPLRLASELELSAIINNYIAKKSRIRKNRLTSLINSMASKWESLNDEEPVGFTPEERSKFNSAFQKAVKLFGFTLLQQLPDLLRKLVIEHDDAKGLDFDFLIVDEYQDLNKCEIELLQHFHKKGKSVLAVGDEDQSIYSFRRAHPIGIREFEKHFLLAKIYDLSICHRCPQNLIDWAQHVILGDLERESRPIPKSTSGQSAKAILLHFKNQTLEADAIAKAIKHLVTKKNYLPSDILVLSRTDPHERFTKAIKNKLIEQSIPIYDSKQSKRILEDKHVVILIAQLRLLENQSDSLAWATLLNGKILERLLNKAESENLNLAQAILDEIQNDYPNIKNSKFKAISSSVISMADKYKATIINIEKEKWGKWIVDNANDICGSPVTSEFNELLLEVDKRLEGYKQNLGFFISQLTPISKDLANEQQAGIRFMTMQSSKGLTARATFVVGVDNDLVPRPEQHLDEERRLLYVAMTRSQEILIMTWANQRKGPQARSGRTNTARRNYSEFLQNGPIDTQDGQSFIDSIDMHL